MKLLEADRSATVAWSPVPGHASYIASGTVAGTMGIDFDTSAHLEIFSVDLNGSANKQMKVVGKTSTSERFHKLCWGLTGTQQGTFPMGLVAGGLASGVVQVWNPAKIIAQEEDCLVATCERHEGPVQGLDFNPFQQHLLASGGSDSEVFIWDLSDASAPTCYNPGAKTHGQQEAAITCVAWNRKVQRILGSTNHNGVTTLWDLKAKRAVLSFHDPNKKIRCRTMAWNPDEETQLITASEDDNVPVIAVWDLRNTYSPVKELVGHTKGVWSISWCPSDSDLFLSSGKDNKTFCWNVKTSELLCEVDPSSQTWNFEVQWSPRIPAVLSTCSLEGKINVYSLQDVRNEQPSTLGLSVSPKTVSHPPKWLKRPVGAAFGFGGKLVYFKKHKANEKPSVQIKQISSDTDVLARASALEKAVAGGVAQLVEYCNNKLESDSEEDKSTWKLLKSLFEENQRTQIHHFLGYNSQSMQKSIQELLIKMGKKPETNNNDSPAETAPEETDEKKDSETTPELFPNGEQDKGEESEGTIFDSFAQTLQSQLPPSKPKASKNVIKFPKEQNTEEGLITQALLLGNFEGAVDICIQTQRWGDAFILAAYSGTELFKKTQEVYFASKQAPYLSVMSCIVKDELRELVEQGELSEWKAILAILATYAKAEDFALLVGILGDRLHNEANDGNAATLCYICAGHLDKTVAIWSVPSKKSGNTVDVHSLQSLIEKIAVFRKAINHKQPLSPVVLQQYSDYALVLASQGQLRNALTYLSPLLETKPQDITSSENLAGYILLDRVFHSQKNASSQSVPPFPFKKEEVRAPSSAPAPAPGRHAAPAPGLIPGRQPPSSTPSPFPTPSRTPVSSVPAPYVPPQPSRAPGVPAPTIAPAPTPVLPSPAAPTYRAPVVPTPTPILPTPSAHPTYQPHPTPTLPTPAYHPPTPSGPAYQPPTPSGPAYQPPTPSGPAYHPPTHLPAMVPSAPKATVPPLGPPPSVGMPAPAAAPLGAPPGAMSVASPPATSAPPVGPPPTGSVPSGKTSKAESAPPANTASPADIEFVVKSLQSTFDTCTKSTDPKISKLAKDVTKRFEPLIEKLNKNLVSGDVVQLLIQLCTAINNGDSRTAQSLNVSLSQDHWEELGSTLLIGFKRLIEMTKN